MSTSLDPCKGLSILLVDDDPSAIQLLRHALADYPDVRFATSGQDALRLLRDKAADVILLDAEMPGESGFELCRKIKESEDLCDIPVIFVTAAYDIHSETRALELGAADFLLKPISPPRVRLRVRLHLQLKHQLDQLRALSRIDGLTQLSNRRVFDERLTFEWRRAERSGRPLSLLLLDVDFFKKFNDTYGHPAGDDCLKRVAAVIAKAARRPTDLPSRFGGEEFAVLLAETPAAGALHVAERLREAVAATSLPLRSLPPSVARVTVSIGVACHAGKILWDASTSYIDDTAGEQRLVEAADRALYRAKQGGRNRVELAPFDAGFREHDLSVGSR